jgi:hypothetical protein
MNLVLMIRTDPASPDGAPSGYASLMIAKEAMRRELRL